MLKIETHTNLTIAGDIFLVSYKENLTIAGNIFFVSYNEQSILVAFEILFLLQAVYILHDII
jgi:hypothetical protein